MHILQFLCGENHFDSFLKKIQRFYRQKNLKEKRFLAAAADETAWSDFRHIFENFVAVCSWRISCRINKLAFEKTSCKSVAF